MHKMTPEQEAAYALDYSTSRGSLSEAGQEAYDRLLEQRRSGELPEPVSLADAEAVSRAVMRMRNGHWLMGAASSCAVCRRCTTSP